MSASNAESAFISTSNYIYFIALGVFAISGITIFFRDIVKYLEKAPVTLIEATLYLVFGSIIYFANSFSQNFSHIVALPPALFISCTSYYSLSRIDKNKTRSETFNFGIFGTSFFALNFALYGIYAVYLQSVSMGYICISAFMSLVGFNVGFGPGFIALGYTNKDSIPSATFASLMVLLVGTYYKVTYPDYVWQNSDAANQLTTFSVEHVVNLFVPAMLWLGSFVYFISLLIVSSKYYSLTFESNVQNQVYYQMQVVAAISGIAAIYFGNYFNISQLYGISGTITTIYSIEKVFEISPKGSGVYLLFFTSLLILFWNTHIRTSISNNGYEYVIEKYFNFYPKSQ